MSDFVILSSTHTNLHEPLYLFFWIMSIVGVLNGCHLSFSENAVLLGRRTCVHKKPSKKRMIVWARFRALISDISGFVGVSCSMQLIELCLSVGWLCGCGWITYCLAKRSDHIISHSRIHIFAGNDWRGFTMTDG